MDFAGELLAIETVAAGHVVDREMPGVKFHELRR
jgi:hypothetical protein